MINTIILPKYGELPLRQGLSSGYLNYGCTRIEFVESEGVEIYKDDSTYQIFAII